MSKLFPYGLLLLLITGISCSKAKQEVSQEAITRPVKYIEVGSNTLNKGRYFTGLSKAQQEARLSFKVSGTINQIRVIVGNRVRKGTLLATLDATDYKVNFDQSLANLKNSEAQIESAQAQVESSRASYISAESNYSRFEKLYETNSISLSEFEQAKSAFQSAEAALKSAQTQVEAAKAGTSSSKSMTESASNQVSYTRMTAPFTGIITAVNAEPNEIVGQGNPIITINSESKPDIEVGIPENVISEIKQGQRVQVKFNSIADATFEGRVYEVGYSPNGSTYPVTIRMDQDDDRIRPGMPASAIFNIEDGLTSETSLLVPPSAVGEDGTGNFVYAIITTGNQRTIEKQRVQIGELKDEGFEIISGLKRGQLVASAGLNVLHDGMQVTLYQMN